MVELRDNLYAMWRASAGPLAAFREGAGEPPERLLQAVWWHQRLQREELRTTDGRRLRVLHPGFWNREPGPDFRAAVIQFEHDTPKSGDIEVDLLSRGWRDHRHHINAEYRNVILHVVWQAPAPGFTPALVGSAAPAAGAHSPPVAQSPLPILPLEHVLDAPLPELATWLCSESAAEFPVHHQGQCSAPLRDRSIEEVSRLLREAALVRFQAKASHLQARARQAGWEQALWEGLFRALGYKHNVWPMQRLAELRPRLAGAATSSPGNAAAADAIAIDAVGWQARLFGAAGLLPEDLPRGASATATYVRRLWDIWWRQRDAVADGTLPRALWRFSGLRPANRPERRLALAAHWLANGTLPAAIEQWCAKAIPDKHLVSSLARVTRTEPDEFWSWHWTLRTARLPRPSPLLGHTRLTDIAVNVILPWLWTRAQEGKSPGLHAEIERRYLVWPAAEDNAVLRLARRRLLGTESTKAFRRAAAQQGLLQIVRDFCQHSNTLCGECRFPEIVRGWR